MKICVIGTGYVGLVSGACFADLGNTVNCVDKDQHKIDTLNGGGIPIYEPGLNEIVSKNYLSGRLKFTTNLKLGVRNSDIIFICVGTPTLKKNHSADLRHVFQVFSFLLHPIQSQDYLLFRCYSFSQFSSFRSHTTL